MNMEKVCRLCGVTSNKPMYNIFNKNDSGHQLLQLIKQCLPILVYRTDPLSKEICETCYTKLNEYSSFQKSTIEANAKFKENLSARIHESPVKLYIDTLENAYQPESIQITNFRSPRSMRNCASQIQVETRSFFTNTAPLLNSPKITPPIRSLKILTPSLINEKSSEANIFVSLQSEDGTIQKKRRLAGPKSRTKMLQLFPPSLLQCALKQINKNMNRTEDYSVSDNTSETAVETETSEYSVSRSESQDRDYVYTPDMMDTPYNLCITEINCLVDEINVDEPVVCNYCMLNFGNMLDLAYHEIGHIKVDIGPKVDSADFRKKNKNLNAYYLDYLARQSPEKPEESPPKVKELQIKPEVKPVVQVARNSSGINPWHERTQFDENSLLIPQQTGNDKIFKVENYVIMVDGVPLKDLSKEDRRACFKGMIINGVKRKYCSLCRHTFKDNWAIESHYLSDVCLYTCKYCGRKFKYQKELFEDHLKLHKGEPLNKIFGPASRFKFKKKVKRGNRNLLVGQMLNVPPKVKPIKIKQLMQKKSVAPPLKIKSEPGFSLDEDLPSSSNSRGRTEPYQAYFCRKCFKVFFNVNEYNKHIKICTGNSRKNMKSSDSKSATSETSSTTSQSRRPVRSCVKDISALKTDSDVDSDDILPKKIVKKVQESPETGYECGVCCSSFPSKQSRNSHMRIHKGHQQSPIKTVLNKIAPKSHTITRQEPPPNNIPINLNTDIRLANLNPAVARLVQNNPHLTIRSFSKAEVEKHQQDKLRVVSVESIKNAELPHHSNESTPEHNIKRVYKCADCEDKFENKSVLYYHKMNSCIVKRHYECAFCRKKFGTYDQYNTHMFYVHPE